MSSQPYFIIAALPADDMNQKDFQIKEVFHMDPQTIRDEIDAMKASLVKAGYNFDLVFVSPIIGLQPVLDRLDKAEHCNGLILGYGMRGHPDPQICIFLEKLLAAVRENPKNVKILFNWDIPSSLDACKRALGEA